MEDLRRLLVLKISLDQCGRPARINHEVTLGFFILAIGHQKFVISPDVRLGDLVIERANDPTQNDTCVVVDDDHAANGVRSGSLATLHQHRQAGHVFSHLQRELNDVAQLFLLSRDVDCDDRFLSCLNVSTIGELQMKWSLAQLEYANREKVTLDEVKAKLTIEASKQNLTRELSQLKVSADRLPKPPVEPAGRAAPGNSYPA